MGYFGIGFYLALIISSAWMLLLFLKPWRDFLTEVFDGSKLGDCLEGIEEEVSEIDKPFYILIKTGYVFGTVVLSFLIGILLFLVTWIVWPLISLFFVIYAVIALVRNIKITK